MDRNDLLREVNHFRDWADNLSLEVRSAEWECDYVRWIELYEAALSYLARYSAETWSEKETQELLYALARDNEGEKIAAEIGAHHPAALLVLARASIGAGEAHAGWQLADGLGLSLLPRDEVEPILLALAEDEAEYVRRISLKP